MDSASAALVESTTRVRFLSQLPRPFIVCVITDRTTAAAVTTMRLGALDGAHTFEINLPALALEPERNLAKTFAASPEPVYTTCRRRSFMKVYGIDEASLPDWTDDERMARQVAAIALGSSAIGIELDTFDPMPAPPLGTTEAERFAQTFGSPAELTNSAAAVARQKEGVAHAKEMGVKVLFSCQTGRPQTVESLINIAETAVSRGADLVKIVTPCRSWSDLFAVFEGTSRLASLLPVPFTLIGAGEAGQLSRSIGANFGSSWLIGQQTLTPGGFHSQPLASRLRETVHLLPWRATMEAPCG